MTSKKKLITLFSLFFFVSALVVSLPLLKNTTVFKPKASANSKITGTFVMFDYVDASYQRSYDLVSDAKKAGIDTLIVLAMGYLSRDNCQTADYELIHYVSDSSHALENFLQAAHDLDMQLYFGTVAHDDQCFSFRGTDYKAINQKMADTTIELAQGLKTYFQSKGWAWDGGLVKGFYINDEMDIEESKNAYMVEHYTVLSQRLKAFDPNKLIFISPWITEASTYDSSYRAFDTIYKNTSIDIISPQDSLGSGLTKTYERDKDHYRALADVTAKYPGRIAWANIESFTKNAAGKEPSFVPTDINKLSAQIATVNPYVQKHITWIFQHTYNISPSFDTVGGWTNQYTPSLAVQRFSLRAAYENYLHSPTTKVTSTFVYGSNLVIKGDNLKNTSGNAFVSLWYLDDKNQIQKIYRQSPVFVEDKETIYLSLASLPFFSDSRPYALSASPLNLINPTTPTSLPPTSIPTSTLVPTRVISPLPIITSTPTPTTPPPTATKVPTRQPTLTLVPTKAVTPLPTTPPPTLTTKPTSLPTSIITEKLCTPCANSSLKSKGDANCDGRIDIADRTIWSTEFKIDAGNQVKKSNWNADFNCDSYVNVIDRSIWSANFSF